MAGSDLEFQSVALASGLNDVSGGGTPFGAVDVDTLAGSENMYFAGASQLFAETVATPQKITVPSTFVDLPFVEGDTHLDELQPGITDELQELLGVKLADTFDKNVFTFSETNFANSGIQDLAANSHVPAAILSEFGEGVEFGADRSVTIDVYLNTPAISKESSALGLDPTLGTAIDLVSRQAVQAMFPSLIPVDDVNHFDYEKNKDKTQKLAAIGTYAAIALAEGDYWLTSLEHTDKLGDSYLINQAIDHAIAGIVDEKLPITGGQLTPEQVNLRRQLPVAIKQAFDSNSPLNIGLKERLVDALMKTPVNPGEIASSSSALAADENAANEILASLKTGILESLKPVVGEIISDEYATSKLREYYQAK